MVHGHGGSWAGATMDPEGKDNVKGQACLGCKRNGLALDMWREAHAEGRQQTLTALHRARAG